MEERVLLRIIEEICDEENIDFKTYSFGYIVEMSKDGKHRYIVNGKFDMNSLASGAIMSDKAATFTVLDAHNIPAVEHKIIFNPTTRENYVGKDGVFTEVFNYFDEHDGKIVVKAKDGSQGRDIFLCADMKRLERKIFEILEMKNDVCLSPFYDVKNEYRTFCLETECLLTYQKNKPYVIGNGINNVRELIEEYDSKFLERYTKEDDTKLENEIDYEFIPNKGEVVYLSWKLNLCQGAKPTLLADKEKEREVQELAKNVATILNSGFSTIDIVETAKGDLLLLEVNSGVAASKFIENVENGYEIAKVIYRKAVLKMFEE